MNGTEKTDVGTPSLPEIDVNLGWDDEAIEDKAMTEPSTEVQESEEPSDESEVKPETEEGAEEPEKQDEEVKTEINPLDIIKVKIDHKEIALSEFETDDLIKKVQLGANYERLENRLNEKHQKVDDLVEIYNEIGDFGELSFDQLIEMYMDQAFKYRADRDTLTEAQVKKDYELKVKERNIQKPIKAKEAEDQKKQAFVEKFPDVDLEKLSKEVLTSDDMVGTYLEETNRALVEQLSKLTKDIENIKKNPKTKIGNPKKQKSEDKMFAGWDD